MSSDYRIMCLSHDEPEQISEDYHSSRGGRDVIENRLSGDRARHVFEHEGHDVIGGRYSYPLVEIYDPRRAAWIDAAWLALAVAAHTHLGADSTPAIARALTALNVWPVERLSLLASELTHYELPIWDDVSTP